MSLVRRALRERDWPEWFPVRRMFDWPEPWPELFDQSFMRVEQFEEDGHLVVRAEMPGLDPDKDVEITISDGLLRIQAERREETRSEDKKQYRSEFRYGSFARTVSLPPGASDEDVKATYHDGILEVRVPIAKGDGGAVRKIPVQRT